MAASPLFGASNDRKISHYRRSLLRADLLSLASSRISHQRKLLIHQGIVYEDILDQWLA